MFIPNAQLCGRLRTFSLNVRKIVRFMCTKNVHKSVIGLTLHKNVRTKIVHVVHFVSMQWEQEPSLLSAVVGEPTRARSLATRQAQGHKGHFSEEEWRRVDGTSFLNEEIRPRMARPCWPGHQPSRQGKDQEGPGFGEGRGRHLTAHLTSYSNSQPTRPASDGRRVHSLERERGAGATFNTNGFPDYMVLPRPRMGQGGGIKITSVIATTITR